MERALAEFATATVEPVSAMVPYVSGRFPEPVVVAQASPDVLNTNRSNPTTADHHPLLHRHYGSPPAAAPLVTPSAIATSPGAPSPPTKCPHSRDPIDPEHRRRRRPFRPDAGDPEAVGRGSLPRWYAVTYSPSLLYMVEELMAVVQRCNSRSSALHTRSSRSHSRLHPFYTLDGGLWSA